MENRLYRRRKDKVFGGIASGLGQYLDIDPIIVRIVFVLITLFHGVGLLVYIIMWIVMPEEPIENLYQSMNEPTSKDKSESGDSSTSEFAEFDSNFNEITTTTSNSRTIVGALLIGIGFIFLLERFIPSFDFELILALGLILLGIGLTFNFFKK